LGEKIVIAVDAMGGDNAPNEIIKGSVDSLENQNIEIILLGNEEIINKQLSLYAYDQNRIRVVNTSEVISTSETPTTAIKKKKDSSLVVGLNLVKQNEAHAFVSAGNTGAILAGATLIIGRLKGVERPTLATLIPNKKGISFLSDSGANVDTKPSHLVQFAKMGTIYMESVMNIKNPKVGLVNIGAEREKGNTLVKESYILLEQQDINFVGNVEATEIPYGEVDIIVCDGFVGNVILKHSEGFAKMMLEMIKAELMADSASKLGAILSKNAFKRVKKKFNADEIGGAPFLGLKSLVVKAHGSSNHQAIKSAINQCVNFVDADVINKISDKLSQSAVE